MLVNRTHGRDSEVSYECVKRTFKNSRAFSVYLVNANEKPRTVGWNTSLQFADTSSIIRVSSQLCGLPSHTHHAEQKCTQPQEITPLHGAFVKNPYFAFCSGVPTRFRYYRAGHQRTCITFGNALSDLNPASSRSNSPRKKHCSSNAGDPKPPCGLTMGTSSLKSRSSGGICPTTSRTCVRAVRCFLVGTNSIWRSMRGGSCERGSRRRNRRRRWSRRGWRLWGV